jgi:hypothetical protein
VFIGGGEGGGVNPLHPPYFLADSCSYPAKTTLHLRLLIPPWGGTSFLVEMFSDDVNIVLLLHCFRPSLVNIGLFITDILYNMCAVEKKNTAKLLTL